MIPLRYLLSYFLDNLEFGSYAVHSLGQRRLRQRNHVGCAGRETDQGIEKTSPWEASNSPSYPPNGIADLLS